MLLFLLLILSPVAGKALTGTSVPAHDASAETDLVSFLQSKTQQHDAIFTEAVQLLESMKSSPSCNRIAASRLVASCQSIGGTTDHTEPNTYLALEHVRSLYAARLAVCELDGAGASIPPPCLPVTLMAPRKKGFFGFSSNHKSTTTTADSMPTEVLESCLRSLESRPQWWTSYSNSRQNAMVICQATRLETEKEELLELHHSIVESSIKLSHGLKEALQMASAESSQRQAFMEATAALQAKLTQDLEATETGFRALLGNLMEGIESAVDSVVTAATSALARVHNDATSLERDIRNATNEVNYLRQMLQAVYDEALAREAQSVHAHEQNVEKQNELALSLQSRLESLVQGDVTRLSQNVETFDASLLWLSERLGLVLQQELSLSERLQNFETSLENSQSKAEALHTAQLQQFDALQAQFRLQQHMETNFQISQALLDKATATAANLQAMIDETTTRYRDSPILGNIIGPSSAWTVCGLLLSLIGAHSPRLALAALLIGAVHLTMTRFYHGVLF
ncbi:hypothetical protein CNMCM6805_001255 [Aspergillus fumigatiaffinis]|uniref:Nuclear membrane fusion protein Kar5 n=1 Tax=Aspergillus fumigatiaffinis TaxID=340414 RepID=A0A8H4GWM7_9EURO|nr:hypothetical protein CNMCM6805_001255 [Aspergillus fumigatiaffinis]